MTPKVFAAVLIGIVVVLGGLFWGGVFPYGTDEQEPEVPPVPSRPAGGGPVTWTVYILNNQFVPRELQIRAGDSVRWVNREDSLHWPASDPHPTHTELLGFDALGELRSGESYTHTFRTMGRFTYHDHVEALNPTPGEDIATGVIMVLP